MTRWSISLGIMPLECSSAPSLFEIAAIGWERREESRERSLPIYLFGPTYKDACDTRLVRISSTKCRCSRSAMFLSGERRYRVTTLRYLRTQLFIADGVTHARDSYACFARACWRNSRGSIQRSPKSSGTWRQLSRMRMQLRKFKKNNGWNF